MFIRSFGVCSLITALLISALHCRAAVLQIGKNFTGATYPGDSTAQPPDAGLAAGPNNVVEFINGRFSVFTKTNASPVRLKTMTDITFWANAGVSVPSQFVSDPRIVFDPGSQRWFASMVDVPSSGTNRFLLAVSATSDPTGTWRGLAWTADPDN